MQYKIIPKRRDNYRVSRYIHSVFFEYFGHVIYDGILRPPLIIIKTSARPCGMPSLRR